MSEEPGRSARATLELDLELGPPRGALTAVNGRIWRFSGWIALASALEAWRDGAFHASSDTGDRAEYMSDRLTSPQEVDE